MHIPLVSGFRKVQQPAPKNYPWPQASMNEVLKVYKPVSSNAAFLGGILFCVVAAFCFIVASKFDNIVAVAMPGLLGFGFAMLGLQCLSSAIYPGSTITIFKSGMSIDNRFFPWSAIICVYFHENHTHGHHGSPSHQH